MIRPALDQLAREAGLCPARLSRLFKQQTGIGLTAFRQRKCVERFLRLYGRGAGEGYTLIQGGAAGGIWGAMRSFTACFAR